MSIYDVVANKDERRSMSMESVQSRRGYGRPWTYDETVLALGLYFQMPFEKIRSSAQEVVRMAELMERSPASLSMKMDNFGRLDPTLSARGITGLKNGSKLDERVWADFFGKQDVLAERYNSILAALHSDNLMEDDSAIKTPQGLDGVGLARYRINQTFFRKSVLSAYGYRCCITGISDDALLIASHIKPWNRCDDTGEKTEASNGLCLNALHDRAFDKGLITLDEKFRVVVSVRLKDALPYDVCRDYFMRYEGIAIAMPTRSRPAEQFLSFHRNFIFERR